MRTKHEALRRQSPTLTFNAACAADLSAARRHNRPTVNDPAMCAIARAALREAEEEALVQAVFEGGAVPPPAGELRPQGRWIPFFWQNASTFSGRPGKIIFLS